MIVPQRILQEPPATGRFALWLKRIESNMLMSCRGVGIMCSTGRGKNVEAVSRYSMACGSLPDRESSVNYVFERT